MDDAENKQIIDSVEAAEVEALLDEEELLEEEVIVKGCIVGRMILCSRCNRGGGTLVKLEDDVYVHQHCGRH